MQYNRFDDGWGQQRYERKSFFSMSPLVVCLMCTFVALIGMSIAMGAIMIQQNSFVSGLPLGRCLANNGTVTTHDGAFSASAVIENVPVVSLDGKMVLGTVTLKFPPPPTALNLQSLSSVKQWEVAALAPANGASCRFDLDNTQAWTEPINKTLGIAMIIVSLLIVLFFAFKMRKSC